MQDDIQVKKSFYTNGMGLERIEMTLNDEYHNPDGVALLEMHPGGGKRKEAYYVHGALHHEKHPALNTYDSAGNLTFSARYRNGALHHEKFPAVQRFEIAPNGERVPVEMGYYVGGLLHKAKGPAERTRFSNGKLRGEKHALNGKFHRENGPAIWEKGPDGTLIREEYWKDGKQYFPTEKEKKRQEAELEAQAQARRKIYFEDKAKGYPAKVAPFTRKVFMKENIFQFQTRLINRIEAHNKVAYKPKPKKAAIYVFNNPEAQRYNTLGLATSPEAQAVAKNKVSNTPPAAFATQDNAPAYDIADTQEKAWAEYHAAKEREAQARNRAAAYTR